MKKEKRQILTWNYNASHVFGGPASAFSWSPNFVTKTDIRILSLYCRAIKEPATGAADSISFTELAFSINGVSGGNNVMPFTVVDTLTGTPADNTAGFYLHSYVGDPKHKMDLYIPVGSSILMQMTVFDSYVLNDGAIIQLLMEWERLKAT